MKTKLTLSIDKNIVSNAKKYTAMNQTSISRLVELFLHQLSVDTSYRVDESKYPITASLSGCMKSKLTKSDDELITEYLEEKYA